MAHCLWPWPSSRGSVVLYSHTYQKRCHSWEPCESHSISALSVGVRKTIITEFGSWWRCHIDSTEKGSFLFALLLKHLQFSKWSVCKASFVTWLDLGFGERKSVQYSGYTGLVLRASAFPRDDYIRNLNGVSKKWDWTLPLWLTWWLGCGFPGILNWLPRMLVFIYTA